MKPPPAGHGPATSVTSPFLPASALPHRRGTRCKFRSSFPASGADRLRHLREQQHNEAQSRRCKVDVPTRPGKFTGISGGGARPEQQQLGNTVTVVSCPIGRAQSSALSRSPSFTSALASLFRSKVLARPARRLRLRHGSEGTRDRDVLVSFSPSNPAKSQLLDLGASAGASGPHWINHETGL